MSDYFGALLRSAGALAAPAGMPAASAAAAPGDDLVEREVEVEAGGPDERPPTRAEPAREQATEAAAWPADAPGVEVPAQRADMAWQQPAAPLPRHEDRALAHPLVRAALRWVEADAPEMPAPTQKAVPTRGAAPPRAVPSPEAVPLFAPAHPIAGPADEGRVAAAPSRPPADPEIELTQPAAPRRHAAADSAAHRPAAPARTIDLHIGTIHVAVDAPPPRAVVQPIVQPAPRPQPPAAEGSGFSRLRLPRL
jgi:hypothetical protein